MMKLARRSFMASRTCNLLPSPSPSPSPCPFSSSSSSPSSSSACASLDPGTPLFLIDPQTLTRRLQLSVEQKDAEETWRALQKLKRAGVDLYAASAAETAPDMAMAMAAAPRIQTKGNLIARSLSLLSSSGDALCLLRAHKLLSRLNRDQRLDLVEGSLLAKLAMAHAEAAMFDLSAHAFRLMLQHKRHYPPLRFWKRILEMWGESARGAIYTVKVFFEICRYCQVSSAAASRRHGDGDGDGDGDDICCYESVKPDMEACTIALRACATLGDAEKAEEVVAKMPRLSLSPDTMCFCLLMRAYEKGGRIEQLSGVLARMKQARKVPDRATLNSLLRACVKLGEIDIAAQVVLSWSGKDSIKDATKDSMKDFVVKDSIKGSITKDSVKDSIKGSIVKDSANDSVNGSVEDSVTNSVKDSAAQVVLSWSGKASAKDSIHDSVKKDSIKASIHDSVREDSLKESVEDSTENSVEDSIGDWGGGRRSHRGRLLLQDWGYDAGGNLEPPCTETYVLLLKAFVQKGRITDAARLLAKLLHRGTRGMISEPGGNNNIPCASVIEGLLNAGLRDEANSLLEALSVENTPADARSYNVLIEAYCRLPQPVKAEAVLHDARRSGHLLGLGSHACVVDAYNLLGDYDSAHRVFREMKRAGIGPLEPVVERLLALFEKHCKPYMMFKLLNSASCEPGRVGTELRHWNRAVRAFCRAKHMFDAKAVVRAMKGLGLEPDAETYVSLLDGYVLVGGNTNEVLMLWAEIRAKTTTTDDDDDHGDGSLRLDLALLDGFLCFFIRYGYFNNALDAIAKMDARQLRPDKDKYRNMYWHLHRDLYTSKHRSPRRVDLSQERRQQVDAFKRWVGISPAPRGHG